MVVAEATCAIRRRGILRRAGGRTASAGFPTRTGAVAQLGERVNGIHEVSGSIPLGSTIRTP